MPKEIAKQLTLGELEKAFEGDVDLMLFFVSWLKNGMKASFAYKELHPNVSVASSEVLGHKWLSRIKEKIGLDSVMSCYGLNLDTYITQLKAGVEAEKRDQFSGEMYPDHAVRLKYHDKIGKLLGIEIDSPTTQVNIAGKEMSVEFIGLNE
jgi:hypothetical protein